MPFDTTHLQNMLAQYELPVMIFGGLGVAIWLILAFRALQVHNRSDVAQLDRAIRHKP